jgi:hypothetical protein
MRKILFLIAALSAFLTSCEKEEAGGTEIQKIAGDWLVTVDAVDANREIAIEDPYGIGHIHLYTYNTVRNVPTEMWVDDGDNFWEFKVIVDLDYIAGSFATRDFVDNHTYESKVKISDGKVLYGQATTPAGMPADSIVFYISFDDDDDYENYRVSGFRYTGLANDE